MDDAFPVIPLSGGPVARGQAHGRALAKEIADNARAYVRLIAARTGRSHNEILHRAGRFADPIEAGFPELFIELENIALGARLPLAEILAINCRTELMANVAPECSTLAFEPGASTTGAVLAAQNWDWIPEARGRLALLDIRSEHLPRILTFCEAGQLAKIGLNSQGLGALLNILMAGPARFGIPIHLFLRRLLEQPTIDDALALAETHPPSGASHIALVDQSRVVGLEFGPRGLAQIEPQDHIYCHTNHFLDPDAAPIDQARANVPDSTTRLERLRQFTAPNQTFGVPEIKKILADHQGHPTSICRHMTTDTTNPWHTLASLILDPASRTMHILSGQPCLGSWQSLRVGEA